MNWTIDQLHIAYNEKKTTVEEVTQEYLKKIKSSKLNAYLTVCEDRALRQAKALDVELKKNGKVPKEKILFGVPMGIKDILTVDGVRTTCGSKILEHYIPPYTSTVVQRLESSGAITLGKLNMDEFAMGSSNENSAYGPVDHPTHPGYVPGGSSGGSAAAVKADLCVASIGSDTGGSIRLPASFCGVVGVRPTYGRVSRYGAIAFASSLDQAGPLGKNMADTARVFDSIAGFDSLDATTHEKPKSDWAGAAQKSQNWQGLRIGVPQEYFTDGIDHEVKASIEKSLDWAKSQGAQLVPISLPHTEYAIATYYIVAVCEASSNLARFDGVRFGSRPPSPSEDLVEFYKQVRASFGSEVKRRILLGTFALSSGYYDAYYKKACQVRRLISEDFNQAFQKVDVIASPVAPMTAFKSGEKSKNPLQLYLVDIFTIPSALSGLPCLSLPCGEDTKKLPIGLQLIGPHFSEDKLFTLASAFEKGLHYVSSRV